MGNMVDGLEILTEHDKFKWFKVVLRQANADQFLTHIVGADNIEAINSYYSLKNDLTVMNIAQLKKDGSYAEDDEWHSVERSQFIKQICGSFYTPNNDELKAIDEMLEVHRNKERKLISAIIKNYFKTSNLNFRDDSSFIDGS